MPFAGDPDSKTPQLDAIARESRVFSRCYTASPVCMPARTSLITGLYPHSTGCRGNANELFVSPGSRPSLRDSVFCEINSGDHFNYMVRNERFKWFMEDIVALLTRARL